MPIDGLTDYVVYGKDIEDVSDLESPEEFVIEEDTDHVTEDGWPESEDIVKEEDIVTGLIDTLEESAKDIEDVIVTGVEDIEESEDAPIEEHVNVWEEEEDIDLVDIMAELEKYVDTDGFINMLELVEDIDIDIVDGMLNGPEDAIIKDIDTVNYTEDIEIKDIATDKDIDTVREESDIEESAEDTQEPFAEDIDKDMPIEDASIRTILIVIGAIDGIEFADKREEDIAEVSIDTEDIVIAEDIITIIVTGIIDGLIKTVEESDINIVWDLWEDITGIPDVGIKDIEDVLENGDMSENVAINHTEDASENIIKEH